MIQFDTRYFERMAFTKTQVKKNFDNAAKDLRIAREDRISEVKFNYAYSALIKAGIALISLYNQKIKSVPGHHAKIIETIARILKDETVNTIGNVMRSKRNIDLYAGGVDISEKESREYMEFVGNVVARIKELIFRPT